jgi:acyl carrier protein
MEEHCMTNLEKYMDAFVATFGISKESLSGLSYQSIQAWDSVGHMSLIAALEDAFNITMDTDSIIDFSSFEKGKEILSNYSINL